MLRKIYLFPEQVSKYKISNTNESNNNIMKIKTYNTPNSIKIIKTHENINYLISRNNKNLLKYNPILRRPNLATGNTFDINKVSNNDKIKRKINCYKIKENNINNGLIGSNSFFNIEKKLNLRKRKIYEKISKNILNLNITNPRQSLYKEAL